jgi:hypothetical protein
MGQQETSARLPTETGPSFPTLLQMGTTARIRRGDQSGRIGIFQSMPCHVRINCLKCFVFLGWSALSRHREGCVVGDHVMAGSKRRSCFVPQTSASNLRPAPFLKRIGVVGRSAPDLFNPKKRSSQAVTIMQTRIRKHRRWWKPKGRRVVDGSYNTYYAGCWPGFQIAGRTISHRSKSVPDPGRKSLSSPSGYGYDETWEWFWDLSRCGLKQGCAP